MQELNEILGVNKVADNKLKCKVKFYGKSHQMCLQIWNRLENNEPKEKIYFDYIMQTMKLSLSSIYDQKMSFSMLGKTERA